MKRSNCSCVTFYSASLMGGQGTQIYDAKRGALVDLGILDVMQIFGRAGRPQFDKFGEGTIITTHDKLSHYLTLLTQQNPIESQFLDSLADNLNAEVRVFVLPIRTVSIYLFVHVRKSASGSEIRQRINARKKKK